MFSRYDISVITSDLQTPHSKKKILHINITNSKIAYFFHYVGKLFLQTTHGMSCMSTCDLNFRIKTCVKSTDLGTVSVSLAGTVPSHNWDF